MPGRTIFRESAIEAYRRRTERDIVPRLVARPIIVGCWLLLGTFVAAALVAWSVRVPTYVGASGAILAGAERPPAGGGRTGAVLFLSPDRSSDLRDGQPVRAQIGSSGRFVQGAVTRVERRLIGPAAARRRYRIGADLVTEPSIVVAARLDARLRPETYGGSRITARVEIGSQRLLGLLPGLGGDG
jgi:hypothetical protein